VVGDKHTLLVQEFTPDDPHTQILQSTVVAMPGVHEPEDVVVDVEDGVVVEHTLLVQTNCLSEPQIQISHSTVTNSPGVQIPVVGDVVVGDVGGDVGDVGDRQAVAMSQSPQLLVITSPLPSVSVAHQGVGESVKVHWL